MCSNFFTIVVILDHKHCFDMMSSKNMIKMTVLKPVCSCVTSRRKTSPNVLQYAYEKTEQRIPQ